MTKLISKQKRNVLKCSKDHLGKFRKKGAIIENNSNQKHL